MSAPPPSPDTPASLHYGYNGVVAYLHALKAAGERELAAEQARLDYVYRPASTAYGMFQPMPTQPLTPPANADEYTQRADARYDALPPSLGHAHRMPWAPSLYGRDIEEPPVTGELL